jgi:von Willebrand factor type A domain
VTRAAIGLWLTIPLAVLACAGVTAPPAGSGNGGGAGPSTGVGGGGGHVSGLGGTGVTVDGGLGGSMCGLQTFDVNRKPVELFLVIDRSASMEDDAAGNPSTAGSPSKWSQLIPALSTAILQADPTISWGMKAFPEAGNSCAAGTVTTKIDVQIASGNAAQLNTAVLALTDPGNGTPTGAAIRVATNYLKGLSATDDSRKFILLATDGEPSCAGSAGALTSDTTGARTDAIAAVTDAATAGFHTFVVGVATTKANDAATLNSLAVAGLEPSPDARPGATRFFLASNQAQLVSTLEAIVNPVASNCVFPLNAAPPVPENIAVKVNGAKTPHDTAHANGWDYTDPAYSSVQVFGAACDLIKSNGNMVEIIFGCKDVIIP